ncbi:hypothetical protein D478_13723 [Brevibacillus agri BAB-2500]|nr:hypothetical protein D478_13723 [Brevibacillus agri BAB-2500]
MSFISQLKNLFNDDRFLLIDNQFFFPAIVTKTNAAVEFSLLRTFLHAHSYTTDNIVSFKLCKGTK